MVCLRIARLIHDYVNAAIFVREMGGRTKEVVRVLYDDMAHLKSEALEFADKCSSAHWLHLRTLDFSLGRDDQGDELKVLTVAVGELDSELDDSERSISDLAVPAGMSPYDTAAFTDSYQRRKAWIRLRIRAIHTIKQ